MLHVPAMWMLLACAGGAAKSSPLHVDTVAARAVLPAAVPDAAARHRAVGSESSRYAVPSTADIAQALERDPASLGSLSLGRPNLGALVNAAHMESAKPWEVVSPSTAWATAETIAFLERAITHVSERHPGAHRLHIGDLSREHGGPIRPHLSHQSGRDADIGYYYLPGSEGWYQNASERTLDRTRSWALVRALVTETDAELILIDQRVQRLLYEEALASGEDAAWLDTLFGFRKKHPEPLIRHAYGHRTHIHVRFFNPRAQALAAQAYEALHTRGLVTPRRLAGRRLDGRRLDGRRASGVAQKPLPGSSADVLARLRAALPKNVVPRVSTSAIPPRRLPPAHPGAVAAARATPQLAPEQ